MQGQLSQKEKMLLEDLKKEEDLCVIKYQNYAQQAQDPVLRQLFSKLASDEQRHYSTVDQILQSGGQVKAGQGQSGGQKGSQGGGQGGGQSQNLMSPSVANVTTAAQGMPSAQAGPSTQPKAQVSMNKTTPGGDSKDQILAHDMLSTEKYVSSAYDTGVFESAQPQIRQALQKIQQEEQGHGEQIFQYMNSHGMYPVQ
ncbi:MAG TPA: spore coat protein [Bacillota bacterium]|nr:spore coat protein [Bacillota bacterium]